MKFNRWVPWIYALPMIVFVMGIFAYPIATLFLYSVQNVGASAFASSSFAGLANYRYIFADPLFATAIVNNLKLFLCVPVMVVLPVWSFTGVAAQNTGACCEGLPAAVPHTLTP